MPQSSQTELTPERLSEIKDLLKYESPIAFYSHRAKESMLLLVAEAEEAARLRVELAATEGSVRQQIAADFEAYGKQHDTLSWGQAFYIARDGLGGAS